MSAVLRLDQDGWYQITGSGKGADLGRNVLVTAPQRKQCHRLK